MADISKIKPNGANGTEYDVKDATARSAIAGKANDTQTFTEASTRANIASGENMSTLFGKIKKFFSDLKTVAFTGSYSDLSGQPTIPAAVAVKGNAESAYRTGNVNLTPANIGLGNVNNTADANKSVNYATSAGSAGIAGKALVSGENSGAYISVQAEGTTVIDSDHDSHYYFPSCKAVTSYLNSNLTFFDIGNNIFREANTDFNGITRSGYYLNTLGVSNRPPSSSGWYILLVFRPYKDSNGEFVVQLAFGLSTNKAHFRFKNTTTWTSWTALN